MTASPRLTLTWPRPSSPCLGLASSCSSHLPSSPSLHRCDVALLTSLDKDGDGVDRGEFVVGMLVKVKAHGICSDVLRCALMCSDVL